MVAPDPRSLGVALRRLDGRPFAWAYLGQNISKAYRTKRSFQGRGTHIDTVHRFHQAAEELREPFLTYLYQIGRELDTLRWWMCSVSHRSPYVSKVFHQACYLKVALDLARAQEGPEPLVVVAADKPVRLALERNLARDPGARGRLVGPRRSAPLQSARDTVSMLIHRAAFVAREAGRVFQSRRLVPHPHVPTEPATLIFCWVDPSNIRRGHDFHTYFFGDLAAQLGELGCRVAVVPMVGREVPVKESLLKLRDSPLPLMVTHRYLSYKDLIWIAMYTCRKTPLPRILPTLCGMDISPLIEEDLRAHWVTNYAPVELLILPLVRRLAATGASVERIIYIYENQPWERAICWQARRSLPGAQIVAYQHARLPRMLLNWYLAPGGEGEAPLPDRIVSIGPHSAGLMRSDGYDPAQIRVGGALQMQSLLELRSDPGHLQGPEGGAIVLVAPSNSLEETAELADLAAQLFSEGDGIRIVIKCHPIMPFERVTWLIGEPLPQHVEVSEEPITELMLKSSVMVYSGSTVCIQALALELPLVHVRPQFDLDTDPLEAVPDARLEATGVEELRQRIRWVLEHREEYVAQHRERWSGLVEELYGPVTEESFRAFIE